MKKKEHPLVTNYKTFKKIVQGPQLYNYKMPKDVLFSAEYLASRIYGTSIDYTKLLEDLNVEII